MDERILEEQIMIVEAISRLRADLKKASFRRETWMNIGKIMVRISTLYSLLDVTVLKAALVNAKQKSSKAA